MSFRTFDCVSALWIYPGDAAWHFLTVPIEVSNEIWDLTQERERRGFGSVRVAVRIGSSRWQTSIFPDKKSGCYLLPVKKQIRAVENLAADDEVRFELEVLDT